MTPGPVIRALEALDVSFALIGAHAMAIHGYPRFTADIDLLTTDRRVLDAAVWATLVADGATVDARRGDADDPLAGVVHIVLPDGMDVDVVVGRWPWETALVDRAAPVALPDVTLRVPGIGDLILLKLAAGGYIDRQDAAALLALGDRQAIVRDVEAHISDVRPDVRTLWQDLLASVPGA